MRGSLSISVAQPSCIPGDLAANVAAHAATVVRAAHSHLVVFPELSLSGYVLDAADLEPGGRALAPLVAACARTGSTALAGAPVREGGNRFIATLAVSYRGAEVVYRKMFLGPDEEAVFSPGTVPAVLEVRGWRVGAGICKDTRILAQIEGTLALGIDLYVGGLVHHPHELAEQDARAARIIELGRIPVAFASAAGCVGSEYSATAGHSSVWAADGSILARAGAAPGEVVTAVLNA